MQQQTTTAASRHTLCLTGRERAVITGVSDVDCFNEQLVVLLTDAGQMTVTGEGPACGKPQPQGRATGH